MGCIFTVKTIFFGLLNLFIICAFYLSDRFARRPSVSRDQTRDAQWPKELLQNELSQPEWGVVRRTSQEHDKAERNSLRRDGCREKGLEEADGDGGA